MRYAQPEAWRKILFSPISEPSRIFSCSHLRNVCWESGFDDDDE